MPTNNTSVFSVTIKALDQASQVINDLNKNLKTMQATAEGSNSAAVESSRRNERRFKQLGQGVSLFGKAARTELDTLSKNFTDIGKKIGGTIDTLASAFKLSGLAVGAALATKPIETMANAFIKAADAANSMLIASKSLNIPVEQIERFQSALGRYGISNTESLGILYKVQQQQFEARQGHMSSAFQTLSKLGVDVRNTPINELITKGLREAMAHPEIVSKQPGGYTQFIKDFLGSEKAENILQRGPEFFDQMLKDANAITVETEKARKEFQKIYDIWAKIRQEVDSAFASAYNWIALKIIPAIEDFIKKYPGLAGALAGAGTVALFGGAAAAAKGALGWVGKALGLAAGGAAEAVVGGATVTEVAEGIGFLAKLGRFFKFGPIYAFLGTLFDSSPAGSKGEEEADKKFMQRYGFPKGMLNRGDRFHREPGKGYGFTSGTGVSGTATGGVSLAQMKQLALDAGFPADIAPVIAATWMHESSGNPMAHGAAGEKGISQINPHAWGQKLADEAMGNPKRAAEIGYMIWKKQGLSAWSSYNSGAYKQYLDEAIKAKPQPYTGGGSMQPHGRGVPPGAGAGLGANFSSRVDLAQVNPALTKIAQAAATTLPKGYRVEVTSGARTGGLGGSQHHGGNAVDVQIYDPEGHAISNRGQDTTGIYEKFARGALGAEKTMFPDLYKNRTLAWGRNFETTPGSGVADLMHIDLGGDRGKLGPALHDLEPILPSEKAPEMSKNKSIFPPWIKRNSKGEVYSPELDNMSADEKAKVDQSMKAILKSKGHWADRPDKTSDNDSSHKVQVSFDNAPAGMRSRITESNGSADLNLRTRYSLGVV